jgi:hypothetical protein
MKYYIYFRFDIGVSDFYNENKKDTLTNSIATFLGVPPN